MKGQALDLDSVARKLQSEISSSLLKIFVQGGV
eukprot:CAMPEP_0185746024 /NCGR_PEP_ID=MMETSP1174-20130828/4431_1 /TAXON_ID=35687 /ORGANISM="Dictyocha speculum, Strain CCMP1381" /LENGTH=32 /DNA_ID= /DNA_START= /DNA_END= /DNA_ORIENTATION=